MINGWQITSSSLMTTGWASNASLDYISTVSGHSAPISAMATLPRNKLANSIANSNCGSSSKFDNTVDNIWSYVSYER